MKFQIGGYEGNFIFLNKVANDIFATTLLSRSRSLDPGLVTT